MFTVFRICLCRYDPSKGRVTIDGVDLKDLNVQWWRSSVGLVQQEPILFNVSVGDNIRLGKQSATDEEVH